jgi:hypothetical protein
VRGRMERRQSENEQRCRERQKTRYLHDHRLTSSAGTQFQATSFRMKAEATRRSVFAHRSTDLANRDLASREPQLLNRDVAYYRTGRDHSAHQCRIRNALTRFEPTTVRSEPPDPA